MNRRAKAEDHWRGMPHVQHPLLPATIAIEDPTGSLPSSIELRRLVTVFSGLNGVGKTRLLQHISEAAGSSARLISLHDLCAFLNRMVLERPDIVEAVDEVDPLEVDDGVTLDAVRSIVGRNYSTIRWYALDFDDSPFSPIVGDDVVPFFVVEDGAVTYTMVDMGLGEMAAHVLLWTLWYIRERDDAMLLLDEPDAYFPPRSREPLLDHVATVAVTRGQPFVLTSHSREVIERALQHPDVLAYLGRSGSTVQVATEQQEVREIVQRVLYPDDQIELVGWIEDEAALAFARALLRRIDPRLLDRTALYWGTGTGDLETLQSRLPRPARHPRMLEFAFFIDGNEGPRVQPAGRWPMIWLPGGTSPDEVFQDRVPNAIQSLSTRFEESEAVCRAMLSSVEGFDAHDWTNDLAGKARDRSHGLASLAEAALDGDTDDLLLEEFRANLKGSGLRIFRGIAS